VGLRRAVQKKEIAWPSEEEGLARFDLESLFAWGPEVAKVDLLPAGWTMADAKAAWHVLGEDAELEQVGEGCWAWDRWGRPRGR
jgi:hypothetical protein